MKSKVLMYGVSTYKNRGVEALVQSTINQINKDSYEISIASFDHEYNKNYYKKAVSKYVKHYKKTADLNDRERELESKYKQMPFDYNNFELLYQNDVVRQLKKSDISISIGGDNYCYDYCTWLYSLDRKSCLLGKKTVLWGVSLFEEIDDMQLVDDIKNFDVVVVRESLTYNAIKKYISNDKIIFSPDCAFSLPIKRVNLAKWYEDRKIVALNLSPLTIKNDAQYDSVINLINHILKDTDYSILLLPHVTTDDCNDLTILKKIKDDFENEDRIYLEDNDYNCNELKYIISNCQILVAARTHASIAAYSTSVPTLVIGYSVKSKGIAKDIFGSYDNYVISSDKLSTNDLIKKFDYINDNKEEIKELLNKKMPSIRQESAMIFTRVIKKLDEQLKVCNDRECIGCGVCVSKCHHGAIRMDRDKDGFMVPSIDFSKCTKCGSCKISCPIINKRVKESKFVPRFYGAKTKKLDEQLESTSGGVFSVLARSMFKLGGVVYGCEMHNNKARHIRITKETELYKIRGSKYIQSTIYDSFPLVKDDLKNNKKVLFSGTPCQIGALTSYLNGDHKNLITVSVVCHGVMNDKVFSKYLNEISKEYDNSDIEYFNFRTKDNKWTQSSVKYKVNNEIKVKSFLDDSLMNLYLKNLVIRDSCFNCHYKGKNNIADIIIGDFWGVEVTHPEFLDQNGVSFVQVNSSKGNAYLDNIKFFEQVDFIKANRLEIEKYNPSLVSSVENNFDRYNVFKEIENNSMSMISKCYENKKIVADVKHKVNNLNNKVDSLNNKVFDLTSENTELSNKIVNIYASKRWKLIDKPLNLVNKFLGRM